MHSSRHHSLEGPALLGNGGESAVNSSDCQASVATSACVAKEMRQIIDVVTLEAITNL